MTYKTQHNLWFIMEYCGPVSVLNIIKMWNKIMIFEKICLTLIKSDYKLRLEATIKVEARRQDLGWCWEFCLCLDSSGKKLKELLSLCSFICEVIISTSKHILKYEGVVSFFENYWFLCNTEASSSYTFHLTAGQLLHA